MTSPLSAQEKIVHIHQRLYSLGFSVGNDGNTSSRYDAEKMWITPTGLNKANLLPEQISLIEIQNGRLITGKNKPSTEWQLHSEIYKAFPDLTSIVHAHPPYSIACSLIGISLEEWFLPELMIAIGSVPTLTYTCPGTLEIAKQAAKGLQGRKAVILQRHGVVSIGPNLDQTLTTMECVEHAAKILLIARSAGRLTRLSKPDQARLKKQIKGVYTAS